MKSWGSRFLKDGGGKRRSIDIRRPIHPDGLYVLLAHETRGCYRISPLPAPGPRTCDKRSNDLVRSSRVSRYRGWRAVGPGTSRNNVPRGNGRTRFDVHGTPSSRDWLPRKPRRARDNSGNGFSGYRNRSRAFHSQYRGRNPVMRLLVDSISKSYGPNRVLTSARLAATEGCVVGVLGRMGCGKSTLLRIAGGIVSADSGWVEIDGKRFIRPGRTTMARRGLFFLGENDNLAWRLTVRQHFDEIARRFGTHPDADTL